MCNAVTNSATGATIAGGGLTFHAGSNSYNYPNLVSDDFGTVSGGYGNTAGQGNGSGTWATVGGGRNNIASGVGSTVGGGDENTASGAWSTVAGGDNNNASGDKSTVAGESNTATGTWSTVAGGFGNTASNDYSTVAGGQNNTAGGSSSFAAGFSASATDDGSFPWCQQDGTPCSSLGRNSFVVAVKGPIYFLDNADGETGCYLSAGSGSWTCSSDRNLKNNIVSIDSRSVLERVAEMPISQWSMKADSAGHKHIGPMAQDFYAAFGLGETDRYIAQGDAQGVALASIQGLYQAVQERDEQIRYLQSQLKTLEERMARMEAAGKRFSTVHPQKLP